VSSRQVLSASLAHCSLVAGWLSTLMAISAVSSNYISWLTHPSSLAPSSHLNYEFLGQEASAMDHGHYSYGITIASGLFQVWRTIGLCSITSMKLSSAGVLIVGCIIAMYSYYELHLGHISFIGVRSGMILGGLSMISWSGHLLHISAPLNILLSCGVDPEILPKPEDLLYTTSQVSLGGGWIGMASGHHLYAGEVLLILGWRLSGLKRYPNTVSLNSLLSVGLGCSGIVCMLISYYCSLGLLYTYLSTDYIASFGIFTHHLFVAGILLVGGGSHATISLLNNTGPDQTLLLLHRDIIIGHLIYLVIFLGFHSFGLYIHNDVILSLSRPFDSISDYSICMKPIYTGLGDNLCKALVVDSRIGGLINCAAGTSDFLSYHIHAFTLHTTVLVLLKGMLYSRSSRTVPDKYLLSFRYPCDGPGRGGTCQLSPWDHIYLTLFWLYNASSVLVFTYLWKNQSDVWGSINSGKVEHLTAGDYSSQGVLINGWLKSFLWVESGSVIQSYGTSTGSYGLIFLCSHFLWAISLMFLYSGRGYWQELIESILWSHNKLRFSPAIAPRALSITQGRFVGITHYLMGGYGCTWSFAFNRLISISG
jgi:photosystem I P700 chlorophyll a apoprotein A1